MKYDEFVEEQPHRTEHLWVARPVTYASHSLPLIIEAIGNGQWREGEVIKRDRATGFGIEYICAGEMVLIQDGREYLIQPETVYLLQNGKAHEYHTGPAGFILKRFIRLGGLGLDHYWRLLGLWNYDVLPLPYPRIIEQHMKQIMKLIATADSEQEPQLGTQLSCHAYQILINISQAIQPDFPPIIEKTLAFMQENLERSLSRQEICDYVGISMTHLNRLFGQYLGCTPIAYFLRQKFEWTAQLLKTTRLSMKEISYKAGIDDPLYFSSQFKKYFGVSPKHYRNSGTPEDKPLPAPPAV